MQLKKKLWQKRYVKLQKEEFQEDLHLNMKEQKHF